MSVRELLIAFVAAASLSSAPAFAQGFAGLGTSVEGFSLPDPDVRLIYPEDHASHPDFRIEWWYVTSNLTGDNGREYGVQWTLFRSATEPQRRPGWDSPQIWMGHAGLTTEDAHFSAERFARDGVGQAGVQGEPFEAWIDEWSLAGPTLSDVRMQAQGRQFAYDLRLLADGPFVPQGANGFSVKSTAGQASHYYSQPFYAVEGTLSLPEGQVTVTGNAWLDREWSSQPLTKDQTGWDWISLHLDDGDKLMGYRLRDSAGGDYIVGTWIAEDGTPSPLSPGDLEMTVSTWTETKGGRVPTGWQVALPERALEISVDAINPQSWMDTTVAYWEGPVRVTGTHTGRGYLEMTGYE